jgi:hypothetical protein
LWLTHPEVGDGVDGRDQREQPLRAGEVTTVELEKEVVGRAGRQHRHRTGRGAPRHNQQPDLPLLAARQIGHGAQHHHTGCAPAPYPPRAYHRSSAWRLQLVVAVAGARATWGGWHSAIAAARRRAIAASQPGQQPPTRHGHAFNAGPPASTNSAIQQSSHRPIDRIDLSWLMILVRGDEVIDLKNWFSDVSDWKSEKLTIGRPPREAYM